MPHAASSPPSVTVSIVVHRQWALARPLLEQLDHFCHESIAKVVVTVNLPEADIVAAEPDWRFAVEFVHNAEPKGFGANHNAAFTHCSTDWFLVLNPDIRIDQHVLALLLEGFANDARTGLVAPRIQEPAHTGPEPHRRLLTPVELLTRRRLRYRPPSRPDWVAGMFMLLRSEAFRDVGGFDERFHMYCEDFDLCARLQLAGWSLQLAETLTVLHDARRDSRRSVRPLVWHLVSLARVWTSAAFWRFRALRHRQG